MEIEYPSMDSDSSMPEQAARCAAMVVHALQQVVQDVKGQGVRANPDDKNERSKLQAAAVSFIFDVSNESYSFEWMCETVGACPQHIREAVLDGSIMGWERVNCTDSKSPGKQLRGSLLSMFPLRRAA